MPKVLSLGLVFMLLLAFTANSPGYNWLEDIFSDHLQAFANALSLDVHKWALVGALSKLSLIGLSIASPGLRGWFTSGQ